MNKENIGYAGHIRKNERFSRKKSKIGVDILLGVDYIIGMLALAINEC